jgi:hypothetical protein
MPLQLFTDQGEVFLDPLDGDQFIREDLHGGIRHIAEHDRPELAFLHPRHLTASAFASSFASAFAGCFRPNTA